MDKTVARKLQFLSLMVAASGPPPGPQGPYEIALFDTHAFEMPKRLSVQPALPIPDLMVYEPAEPNPRKVPKRTLGHKAPKGYILVVPKTVGGLEGVSVWKDGHWVDDTRFDGLENPQVLVEAHTKTGKVRRILVNDMLYPDALTLGWGNGQEKTYSIGSFVPKDVLPK